MELNKNAFPVLLQLNKVKEICENEFKKKGHKIELKKKMFHLNIVPYWFCYYDIYVIKDNVPETISKQLSLNAMSNKIEDNLGYLFDIRNPKVIAKIELPELEKVETRLKEIIVDKQEAKTTIKKVLAARYKVPIDNISLSGFVEIWVPFWKLETKDVIIRIDAVGGKINNFEDVQKKQKTSAELYKEMITELGQPKKVFFYVGMVFEVVFRVMKNIALFVKKHKIVVIIFLLLLLGYLLFI